MKSSLEILLDEVKTEEARIRENMKIDMAYGHMPAPENQAGRMTCLTMIRCLERAVQKETAWKAENEHATS